MRYASRIKQLEKKTNKDKGEVHIEVARYGDKEKFDEKYALFKARKVLGLVSAAEQQRTFFVCGSETEAKYEDMTVKQAKKILARNEKCEHKT